jgi:Family of unknown function (DUF6527)
MAALSSKLRSVRWPDGVTGIAHWCPGCDSMHAFSISGKNSSGAQWSWDGNVDAPTCSPSMNIKCNTPDMKEYQPRAGTSICHYFLRAGQLQFTGDTTHRLKGQTVPLPDLPFDVERKLSYEWFKDA